MKDLLLKEIAVISSPYKSKFGVPRQSGLVKDLQARIIFHPEYRNSDAFRGLDEHSHIWIIWGFSGFFGKKWSPTVRPPRLGGNKRLGVFSTRSPHRPNPIGLSCVKLEQICFDKENGPVLYVSGTDFMDQTPVYDVKPYLPFADSVPDASSGPLAAAPRRTVQVDFPDHFLAAFDKKIHAGLLETLSHDPRPAYHDDPERVYVMTFDNKEISFTIGGDVLKVIGVKEWKHN